MSIYGPLLGVIWRGTWEVPHPLRRAYRGYWGPYPSDTPPEPLPDTPQNRGQIWPILGPQMGVQKGPFLDTLCMALSLFWCISGFGEILPHANTSK